MDTECQRNGQMSENHLKINPSNPIGPNFLINSSLEYHKYWNESFTLYSFLK